MRRAGVAAASVALALLAAGCSSSGRATKADDPVISAPASSTAAATESVPGPTSEPATPATTPTSSAAPPSSATPTHAQSSHVSAPPVVPRSTCTKLTIRAIPGGASMGQEIAALQFTNDGTAPCELFGYPTVTLLRGGAPIGRPSQPASTAASHRTLAPGETAESLLHNYVGNCQAPLSDSVRVVAPGSSQTLVRPMQLRACVLRVDPLGAPD